MTADFFIKIGPMIGGAVLLSICLISIVRNPGISNVFAVLLVFGAALFAIPAIPIFDLKAPGGFEFSGNATTGQLTEQTAGVKAQLEEIKKIILAQATKSGGVGSVSVAGTEAAKNRNSSAIVVYSVGVEKVAKRLEDELLQRGYQATSVFSDYSELDASKKGPSGSIRYVYTEGTKPIAASVKELLQLQTSSLTQLPDEIRPQMPGDVRILLF